MKKTPSVVILIDDVKPYYSNGDSIVGRLVIQMPFKNYRIDRVYCVLKGILESKEILFTGEEEHKSTFLRMVDNVSSSLFPESGIFEANKKYEFPFIFILPNKLLDNAWDNNDIDLNKILQSTYSNTSLLNSSDYPLKEYFQCLPPSLNDKNFKLPLDYYTTNKSSKSSKITYILQTMIYGLEQDDPLNITPKVLSSCFQNINFIPNISLKYPKNTKFLNLNPIQNSISIKKNLFSFNSSSLAKLNIQPLKYPIILNYYKPNSTICPILISFSDENKSNHNNITNNNDILTKDNTYLSHDFYKITKDSNNLTNRSLKSSNLPFKLNLKSISITLLIQTLTSYKPITCVQKIIYPSPGSCPTLTTDKINLNSNLNSNLNLKWEQIQTNPNLWQSKLNIPILLENSLLLLPPEFSTPFISRKYSIEVSLQFSKSSYINSTNLKVLIPVEINVNDSKSLNESFKSTINDSITTVFNSNASSTTRENWNYDDQTLISYINDQDDLSPEYTVHDPNP